ncbi:MAG: hypothetical protein ABH950_03255 [Candidatus Altiarchaeota archaeon]
MKYPFENFGLDRWSHRIEMGDRFLPWNESIFQLERRNRIDSCHVQSLRARIFKSSLRYN